MSGTISYQPQLRLSNGDLADSYSTSGLTATQNTAFLVRNVQTISNVYNPATSVLDLGGIATPGFAVFVNLDATNYIEVGIDVGGAFYPFLKLNPSATSPSVLPGEQAGPLRLGVSAVYARANTAPVKLFYIIYND